MKDLRWLTIKYKVPPFVVVVVVGMVDIADEGIKISENI